MSPCAMCHVTVSIGGLHLQQTTMAEIQQYLFMFTLPLSELMLCVCEREVTVR